MYDVLTIEDWIRRVYAAMRGINDPRGIWIEAFGYPYVITSLAAVGGTNSGTLQINGNADFVLTRISYNATLSTSTVENVGAAPVPQVTLNIVDGGSSRPFFNAAVHLNNLASAPNNPGRFSPYPRFLSANTSLSVAATGVGTTAETYQRIDLLFEGMNVRTYSGGMPASTLQPTG